MPHFGSRVSLVVLPSGFAVAALCRWGWRLWPAVFLGGVAIELSQQQPLIACLGVGAGLAAGSALTFWILDRCGFDHTFTRGRDVPLLTFAAVVGMVLAPALGYAGFLLAGRSPPSDAMLWMRWWANTTAGVLLIAPALMAASARNVAPLEERGVEAVLWLIGIIACCALVLFGPGEWARPVIALFALMLIGHRHHALRPRAGSGGRVRHLVDHRPELRIPARCIPDAADPRLVEVDLRAARPSSSSA